MALEIQIEDADPAVIESLREHIEVMAQGFLEEGVEHLAGSYEIS